MMAFGFGTFGAATVGNVFVNYASADMLATMCRIAIVFSITFTYGAIINMLFLVHVKILTFHDIWCITNTSYPLAFVGLKNSVLALLSHKASSVASSEAKKNAVNALLLTVITVCFFLGTAPLDKDVANVHCDS